MIRKRYTLSNLSASNNVCTWGISYYKFRIKFNFLFFKKILALKKIKTPRLNIRSLSSSDNRFIFELLNSEDFIKNIGNRYIKTADEAKSYINKILKNKYIEYNVIEKIDTSTPIGILSYVKRDYLEIHDFGFALLPEYYGNGYALEASNAYLENLFVKKDILKVAAISKNDNKPSLKLLEKLGFEFSREIKYEKELIQVFILSQNKFLADGQRF